MGGGGSQPTPPNPGVTLGNATQAANAQIPFSNAGQTSSQYNQMTPYGSTNYAQTGTTPQGTPIWGVNTQFSPVQQSLYNTYTGTQQQAGNEAAGALGFGNYGTISPQNQIGNESSGIEGMQMQQYLQSIEPFFKTQQDQLNTMLANQGFTPNPGGVGAGVGDPAYDNAERQLQTNQINAVAGAAAQFQPSAFNQATQLYGLPLNVGQQLAQWGVPGGVTTGQTTQTPAFGTPNLGQYLSTEGQLAEQQYEAQQAQYNAQQQAMAGLFGVGGQALGNIAGSAIIASALA